jgi:hypothetical protein
LCINLLHAAIVEIVVVILFTRGETASELVEALSHKYVRGKEV